jgi:hypothetical protein
VVTEPGRAGQGQGPAAGDPGVVTWAGSLGVAGRGALISNPERPCKPWVWEYGGVTVGVGCRVQGAGCRV